LIMVRRLMEDHHHVIRNLRATHQLCETWHDAGTATLLEQLIAEAEKRAWFLFEVAQDLEAA